MPTAVDLFAGAGGLSLGLQAAGWEVVAAVERDRDACATYRANVGDHVIEASIEDIAADDLPDCELIAGGPPCQGFSYAGKRDPNDPRNRLWREFFRIVAGKRPAWVLIENVRGMLTAGEDKPLILAFRTLGYHVSPYLLNAADYGVPQRRLRVFCVGNRIGVANPCPPATHAQPPRHLMLGLRPWVTVRQALGMRGPVNEILDFPSSTIRWGKNNGIDRDGHRRPAGFVPILDEPSRALRHGAHGHPGFSPRHLAGYVPSEDDIPFEYAPTVQADPRLSRPGHHGPNDPRMGYRRLTLAERAALQTFPPGFGFCGNQTSQDRQVGNAVPPGVARVLGAAILAAHERAGTDAA